MNEYFLEAPLLNSGNPVTHI